MQSRRVRLGNSRYSLKVRDVSGTSVAMTASLTVAERGNGARGGGLRALAARPRAGGAGQTETAAPDSACNAPVSMRSVVSQLMHSSVIETP